MTKQLPRVIGIASTAFTYFSFATNTFAQATGSASKGGTGSSLPSAGSTELTYLFFIGGVVLFVFGTMKLVLSYREK